MLHPTWMEGLGKCILTRSNSKWFLSVFLNWKCMLRKMEDIKRNMTTQPDTKRKLTRISLLNVKGLFWRKWRFHSLFIFLLAYMPSILIHFEHMQYTFLCVEFWRFHFLTRNFSLYTWVIILQGWNSIIKRRSRSSIFTSKINPINLWFHDHKSKVTQYTKLYNIRQPVNPME